MNTTITEFEAQIPEFLQVMASALRSGYSLAQSLEIAANDMANPLAADVQRVQAELEAGVALPQALDAWRARTPSRLLDWVVAAVYVQLETGGNLANKFQFLAQLMAHLKHTVPGSST